ncbi:AAA family ATPase [Vibrio sp. B1FLJ16]|uniref:AAA family ATPase n=1 Tax=Vibrio sp. B1FLJ16 TaxID=2751178 RepID=UPI0015F75B20|nr:AAA family ATPase [Vibrio sp. B1FLJ16]
MKLKKVEIQAFKSYLQKEDGTFDFTNGDSETPANFISLFAPNGFGKTSFFDAIDFAITKKITRYVRNDKLSKLNLEECRQHNTQGEKQLVIRNKNAPEKLKTLVRVSTDTREKPFISSYKNSQRNSSDLRIQSKSDVNSYFESSMLYQESIDAFLRETNSEDRFLKFSEIDDELAEINSVRTSILSVKSEVSNEKEQLLDEKNQLEKEEKAQLEILNNVDEVNRIINIINESNVNVNLPLISAPYNENNHLALLSRVKELQNNLKQKSDIYRDKTSNLESQLSKVELAISTYKQYLSLGSERERIIVLNDNISKLEQLVKNDDRLAKEIEDSKNRRQDLLDICKDAKLFKEEYSKKVNIDKELEKYKKYLASRSEKFESNKNRLSDILSERKVLEKELTNIKLEKSKLDEKYHKLSDLVKAESNSKEKLDTLHREYNSYIESIKSEEYLIDEAQKLKIDDVSKLIEKEGLSQDEKSSLYDIHNRYLTIKEELLFIDDNIKSKHQRIAEVKKQSSDIMTLVDKATTLILETQQSHCPLCERPNDSYDELLIRISKNSALSDLEKSLMTDMNHLNNAKSKIKNEMQLLIESFNSVVKNYILLVENRIASFNSNRSIKEAEMLASKESYSTIKQELIALNTSVMYMSKQEFTHHLDSRLRVLISRIDELSKSSEVLKKEIEDENVKVDDIHKLQDIENRLLECSKNLSKYLKLNDFFAKTGLGQSSALAEIKEMAISQISAIDSRLSDLKTERKLLSDAKVSSSLTIERSPYGKLDQKEIDDRIHALQEKMDVITNTIPWFFHILNDYDSDSDESVSFFVKSNIEKKLNDIYLDDVHNKKTLALVSTIKDVSNELIGYSDINEIKLKLNDICRKLRRLQCIYSELESDSTSLGNEISSRVNSFFNTNLINKIYQSIDPHPEYKEVIFTCTAEDKPKLLVSARSAKSNQIMSPTLSFSSAQINVLALSIFLARAINAKDDEGNDVDCILIDDPVQSIDAINTLGLIDTLRMISIKFNKQIILTTHDENFHELLKKKVPQDNFSSKFLRLKSFGKVTQDSFTEEY